MSNPVITTVCNALVRDPTTHVSLYRGTTLSTSAFELSMANTDVKGGQDNPLIAKYMHDRQLKVTIDSVTANKQIVAMQVGTGVTNGTYNVLQDKECLMLDASGTGTLANTPIGNVTVTLASGVLIDVTPTAKSITVPSAANARVDVNYVYSATVDRVAIGTTTPPKVVEIYMTGQVRENGIITEYCQFFLPYVQLDGAYKLDFKADGTSTESLSGSALSVKGTTCDAGDVYGYVSWISAGNSAYTYTGIACSPNSWEPVHGSALTQQIQVLGLRGTALPDATISSDCTFAKVTGGATSITVSTSGLVSVADTSAENDTATITASFVNGTNTFTDTYVVTCS
jgi:hypothetical protein